MYKIDFDNPLHIHFIGIGGVSMSGLAEILLDKGFKISGSDNKESDLTKRLIANGAKVSYPQSASNVDADTDVFVYTAAIHPDNPEYIAAEATGKPMLTRAELLGQIMENYTESIAVSGTHGKTSTTSMISQILLEANTDPTISIGGIFKTINSNIRVGQSDTFITEACEYTNSFHSFYPKYCVILNVEEDHMDFFKDINEIRQSFHKFAGNTAKDGYIIINGSIPNLHEITEGYSQKIITFGLSTDYDVHAVDISYNNRGCGIFTPVVYGKKLPAITLQIPGEHNISNALAAIAVTTQMGIDTDNIIKGLESFSGADRRFQIKGEYKGATIVDDYAHHPTEIAATLEAAKNYPHNRIICIFQPHTYTRTKAFLEDFAKALSLADIVVLADIYAAREQDIYGVSSKNILDLLQKDNVESYYFPTFSEIEEFISKNCMNHDLLITMGAGDVVNIGSDLLNM